MKKLALVFILLFINTNIAFAAFNTIDYQPVFMLKDENNNVMFLSLKDKFIIKRDLDYLDKDETLFYRLRFLPMGIRYTNVGVSHISGHDENNIKLTKNIEKVKQFLGRSNYYIISDFQF